MKKTIFILLFSAIALTSLQIACSKSETKIPEIPVNNLKIGDYHQGGFIVYLSTADDAGYSPNTPHGIIAATLDQNTGIAWITGGNTQTTTNGFTSTARGMGYTNTFYMISQPGYSGGAAKACVDYSINFNGLIYSDWYLPNYPELNLLYRLNQLNSTGKTVFGEFYWCSQESSNGQATCLKFINSSTTQSTTANKSTLYRVRAFRNF